MREIQSLNGIWDYRIGQGKYTKKLVPYSDLCVGISECSLNFDAVKRAERAFLVFEGITYSAKVILNNTFLAKLSPYTEEKIEITSFLKDKDNRLIVEINDLGMPFGPSAGWENYSGIIRNVYIEYTNSAIITDVVWHTEFSEDFKTAVCYAECAFEAKDEESVVAVLKDKNGNVAGKESDSDGKIKFTVENPMLWSPDCPNLYTLECTLEKNGVVTDAITQRVGFKELCTKRRKFYLNGKPLFILGVNKHDLFGDKGHTYSEEEMIKEMMMIKGAGCNYVRLVHYPHNKKIIEIADEIGLLVSEEPGLWWSDMKNEETCKGALTVLEKTIKRDRNNVSVAFWLSFNECRFTLDFLKASAEVARKNDPYRMVSGANCMSLEMTKENFTKCGFDFYTMHPYAPNTSRILESARVLTEMPLLFTEWGGYYCDRNERTFKEFIATIVDLAKKGELAGATYWEWAETYDFNRGIPACVDGILHEGLVDIDRNPTPNLAVFTEGFSKLFKDEEKVYSINVCDYVADGKAEYVNLGAEYDNDAWENMLKDARRPIKDYELRSTREIAYGPIIPEKITNIGNLPVKLNNKPYVLSVTKELVVPVNRNASKVFFIGNTSMPVGYPLESSYGEKVAMYTIEYSDGTTDEHIMLNGNDITTATMLHGSSRINPVAANSERALTFTYDKNWEQYLVNISFVDTDENKCIKRIRMKCLDERFFPLVYGISLKSSC